MEENQSNAITHYVDVNATPEFAYHTFLHYPSKWWPNGHSLFGIKRPNIQFDPCNGGKWFEKDEEGNKKYWGEIILLIPNLTIGMTWQINKRWQPVDNRNLASRIGVFFEKKTELTTRVHLSHYELENHGKDANAIIDAISGPNPGATLKSFSCYIQEVKGKL